MIDYTAVREEIESYIQDNFTTVPVVFENTDLKSKDTTHITVYDEDVTSDNLGMGEPGSLITGLIVISVFTKMGIGTELGRTIASELATLIEAYTGSIDFQSIILTSPGVGEGSYFYRHNLNIPYQYIYGQQVSAC